MQPDDADTVLVRYDEIGTKSRQVRRKMEQRLCTNIRNLLRDRGIEADVRRQWSRILIRPDGDSMEAVLDTATEAFGVASASPCMTVPPEQDVIFDRIAALADQYYTAGSFAVRARRAGGEDDHPFSSQDLEGRAGRMVEETVEDIEPEVDLEDPDTVFRVECRRENAYIFMEQRDGPGGLPLGTQEPVVALISGGHDSPVAAWEMMRRGCEVIPVYLDLEDYGGLDHVARAYDTIKTLQQYAPDRDLAVRRVPVGDTVDRLLDQVGDTRMLSYRRFMYRVAERIAEQEDAAGIVTGESVGQKSSQTVSNIRTADTVTELPIHRPLLTWDKQDIVAKAREIGTYEGSKVPAGCPEIAPDYPETAASPAKVKRNEPDALLDWADEAAASMTVEDLQR